MGCGENIKKRREEIGMSQEELARKCGYKSRASISKIEAEETDLTQKKIIVIAKALGIDPKKLCDIEETAIQLNIAPIVKNLKKSIENSQDEIYNNASLFALNLKELMDREGTTNTQLANAVDVSLSAVGKWLSGNVLPRVNVQLKVADYYGVERADLFALKEGANHESLPPDLPSNILPITKKKFPLLGNIACGEPIFADEDFEGYVEAGADIDADFCLRASGDSMVGARIHDGDIVFIKQQPIVDNGQIAAVLIENEATLKRFYYDQASDTVQLMAENPSYAPIVKMKSDLEDIRILGRAIAFQSIIK